MPIVRGPSCIRGRLMGCTQLLCRAPERAPTADAARQRNPAWRGRSVGSWLDVRDVGPGLPVGAPHLPCRRATRPRRGAQCGRTSSKCSPSCRFGVADGFRPITDRATRYVLVRHFAPLSGRGGERLVGLRRRCPKHGSPAQRIDRRPCREPATGAPPSRGCWPLWPASRDGVSCRQIRPTMKTGNRLSDPLSLSFR